MKNGISIDGGWWAIGLLTLIACVSVLAYVRSRPTRRVSSSPAGGDDVPEQKPGVPAAPKKQDRGKHGGIGELVSILGKVLIGTLILVVLLWLVVVGWRVFTAPSSLSAQVMRGRIMASQPLVALGPSDAELRKQAQEERERIERQEHEPVIFTYDNPPEWIPLPFGGYTDYHDTEGGKAIAMQCSDSVDTPSRDASGEEYLCIPGKEARWIRYLAVSPEEGQVTVHYKFILVVP